MSGVAKTIEFVDKCGCFFISTLDDNEQPRVRPFSLMFENNGKIILGMGNHKDVYKQVKAHPRIEISAYYKPDMKWIRLNGKAVEDSDPETRKKAFEIMPSLTDIYNEKSGLVLAMFYIDEPHSTIYSFTGEKPVVLL